MHFVLYVRADGADLQTRRATHLMVADLVKEDGEAAVTPQTLVSIREAGPFEPLVDAIRRDGAFRDALGTGIQIPSLRGYARIRIALAALVVIPIVMLLELDRELVFGGKASTGRLLVDLMLASYIGFELSRATPRMPKVAAGCLTAIALRWVVVETKTCAVHVHPLVWAASALAFIAAGVFLVRVPPRERLVLEWLGKLGISRTELLRATAPEPPSGAMIAAAVGCAAGLPALLHLVRAIGAGLITQSIVFVGFAAIAPLAAKKLGGETAKAVATSPVRIMLAVATGLALTAAAITAGRLFFDAGAEVAHCVNRLDSEARLARAAEAQELTRAIERVRASVPLVFLTAAVFPFAEERIYRGLLQDTLVRRYGQTYGIVATALAFGIAHLGVYEVALYQTVLLGLGFGLAYAEGGLLAAFFVHAVWNLLQVA